MPTLFISYKRGTTGVAPLMEKLRTAKYHLWFDSDDIYLGDTDWQARIDQGVQRCDGVILCITPAACQSKVVQYEVKRARELNKVICPLMLEPLPDISMGLREIGLPERQHVADFTNVCDWDKNCEILLDDLAHQGLRVTRHDRRKIRGDLSYRLHQLYLTRLVEHIGRLHLSIIKPDHPDGTPLETIYVSLPTKLALDVELQGCKIVDWWLGELQQRRSGSVRVYDDVPEHKRIRPASKGWESAALEALIAQRQLYYDKLQERTPSRHDRINHCIHRSDIPLHAVDVAAACDRLIVLGGPGSGKSTFGKHLALCLATEQLDGKTRNVGVNHLREWPHGTLTPIYVELRRFVSSEYFPIALDEQPNAECLWRYVLNEIVGTELADYSVDLHDDLREGQALLILDGLDEVPHSRGKRKVAKRQEQLKALV